MSAPLAQVDDLSIAYGGPDARVAALSGISLDVVVGERLAVIGESGSGKSTFALALAGLLPSSAIKSGSITWPGLGHPPQAGRDIGFVFQDPGASLDPVLRVGEQIAEVARRHLGLSWRQAFAQAESLLGRVRLPDPRTALRAYPHQLSGGQRQRVAIAAAIAAKPGLLIADEATSALDTIVQSEIVALLEDLVREDGMTLLFVTHDIALASQLAQRIAVFRAGSLIEIGPTGSLLAAPQADYTRTLLAANIDLTTPRLVRADPA